MSAYRPLVNETPEQLRLRLLEEDVNRLRHANRLLSVRLAHHVHSTPALGWVVVLGASMGVAAWLFARSLDVLWAVLS